MKQDKAIKPFDDLLMAYITQEGQRIFVSDISDKEVEVVFNKDYSIKLSEEKVETLLASLIKNLSKDTLGSLIQKALIEQKTTTDSVQTITGLSESILEDIKTDMVFTNSIPIKSLGKLLKVLNVSLEKAQAAIEATFEKLSTESKMFLTIPIKAQPSFRKGAAHTTDFDLMRMRSDESYLYQNKEALEKYTKRLSELFNEL